MAININHINMNCASCTNYADCRKIESEVAPILTENGGNWRALFKDDGTRIPTPTRRCSYALIKYHIDEFKNKKMLEIGCGALSEIDKLFCDKMNISYTGIDERVPPPFQFYSKFFSNYLVPSFRDRSKKVPLSGYIDKIAKKMLKILNIRKYKTNKRQSYIEGKFRSKNFSPESYDLIYSNNSIEHWYENENNIDKSFDLYNEDINECYKILRPGGILLIHVAIFVHGNKIFYLGRLDLLEKIFNSMPWKDVCFERWREQYDDLMPYAPVKRIKLWKEEYGLELSNIWVLNIKARK